MRKFLVLIVLLFTAPALADYTMVIPQKPGGGTSQWAQIVATELEKHLGDDLDKYTRHLIDNGIKEKRPFKIEHLFPDFNMENYRLNYPDLDNLTCMQLIDHYVNYGRKEGRIYNKLINKV